MENIDIFKSYVLLRRDAWEAKYNLGNKTNTLYGIHYPNNLKYLDETSQRLIRSLNSTKVHVRDKLITALVYRLVGDKWVLRRYSDASNMFNLERVSKLARRLNNLNEKLLVRYRTPINSARLNVRKGDLLLRIVEDFIEHLPKDYFKGWKCSEIYRHFTEWDKSYRLNPTIAYELCSDFTFINELKIEIDIIPALPDYIRAGWAEITGDYTRGYTEYVKFVEEIMDWYVEQPFLSPKEHIICPFDVAHMVHGFGIYVGNSYAIERGRSYPETKGLSHDSIIITESMYEYYRAKYR